MRRMTTKTKLAINLSLVTLAVLTALGILFDVIFTFSSESRFKSDMVREASELLDQHLTYQNGKIVYIKDSGGVFLRQHIVDEGSQAVVYNNQSEVIGAFGAYEQALETSSYQKPSAMIQKVLGGNNYYFVFEEDQFEKRQLLVLYYPVMSGSKTVGMLQLAKDSSFLASLQRSNMEIMLLLIPMGVLISALMGYFAANSALKPLRRMLAKMEMSNANNLQAKMPVHENSPDEMDQLAKTYNSMLDRIEEGLQKQKEFTANVSHELRKPVTRAVSQLDIAEMELEDAQPEKAAAKIVAVKADLMALDKTVKSLLELTQMSSDPNVYEEVEVEDVINEVLKVHEADIRSKALHVHNLVPDNLCILFSRQHLKIILNNLVSNAVKYNKQKGSVVLSLKEQERQLSLVISDTGVGIDRKSRPYVLTRFFRQNDLAKSHRGNGVGLDLVNTICSIHKLTVGIESRPGKGTSVTVTGLHKA